MFWYEGTRKKLCGPKEVWSIEESGAIAPYLVIRVTWGTGRVMVGRQVVPQVAQPVNVLAHKKHDLKMSDFRPRIGTYQISGAK